MMILGLVTDDHDTLASQSTPLLQELQEIPEALSVKSRNSQLFVSERVATKSNRAPDYTTTALGDYGRADARRARARDEAWLGNRGVCLVSLTETPVLTTPAGKRWCSRLTKYGNSPARASAKSKSPAGCRSAEGRHAALWCRRNGSDDGETRKGLHVPFVSGGNSHRCKARRTNRRDVWSRPPRVRPRRGTCAGGSKRTSPTERSINS